MGGLVFIFGLVIGSFLNVCIYRLPRRISLVKPDSFCPACGHRIPYYYNIPVISYLFLKGKCAYCDNPISPRYILVELLTGILSLAVYWKFGLSPAFGFYLILVYFLIVISFIDLTTQLIYNRVLIYLFLFGVVYNLFLPVVDWRSALAGVLAGGGSLMFFAMLGQLLFRKESMGMGDVKFAAVLGFFLGWKLILLALFSGFVYAVIGIILIKLIRKYPKAEYIPMAPFLTIGVLTFVFWGSRIWEWYWSGIWGL